MQTDHKPRQGASWAIRWTKSGPVAAALRILAERLTGKDAKTALDGAQEIEHLAASLARYRSASRKKMEKNLAHRMRSE